MKLAIAYTVFNGLELLEQSIDQVRDHVDYVIVCYQQTSNTGQRSEIVRKLVENIPGVFPVEYHPNLLLNAKANERRKHQLMLDTARMLNCSHFIMAACDHFYRPEEFEAAKEYCSANDFDVTFTAMFTYYKYPTWQLTPIEEYYMPFIMRIHADTAITATTKYPVLVDPSVRVNTCKRWDVLPQDMIMLHHYSVLRLNVRDKYVNAASQFKPDAIEAYVREFETYDIEKNPGVKYFQGRQIKVVPDYFGLSLE